MSDSKYLDDSLAAEKSGAEQARAAVVARLARLHRKPVRVKPSQSLQPTPEAAKSRFTRLRRKERILIQKSKRVLLWQQSTSPAREPLSPLVRQSE
jgi:hypothetical protein